MDSEDDEQQIISISDSTDSSNEFVCTDSESENEDEEEALSSRSVVDENCKRNDVVRAVEPKLKLENVNALLRYISLIIS